MLCPQECHHILFDDNIKNDAEDSIAGVRLRRDEASPFGDLTGEGAKPPHARARVIAIRQTGTPARIARLHATSACTPAGTRQMHGVHLVRVPTFEPILRPEWFLDRITDCERARAEGLAQSRADALDASGELFA